MKMMKTFQFLLTSAKFNETNEMDADDYDSFVLIAPYSLLFNWLGDSGRFRFGNYALHVYVLFKLNRNIKSAIEI